MAHRHAIDADHDHSHEEHNHTHDDHDHAHDDHGHSHEDHDHEHEHGHGDHDHDHDHNHGQWGWLIEAIPFLHGHSHAEANVDDAMETNDRGIWALKISLLGLGATALFQVIIAIISGSAGLLADTIHNAADALTAIPLWIAFVLGRKAATRRYTYGFGRAEDLALVCIVFLIFASAVVAAVESVSRLLHPHPLAQAGWVIVAALVGFIGNEGVGWFRIRVGQEIGSAALVADGQHARVDGLTSLAVLIGAIGSLLGIPLADPIVGLVITIAILAIVKDTAVTMWHRLMDAVDPQLVDALEREAAAVPEVKDVHDVRLRWIGHKLQADLHVTVDEELPTRESHRIAEEVRHALFHTHKQLTVITVHVDPYSHSGEDAHAINAHHRERAGRGRRHG
jgi:cation diffusion facilitator family transporter